VVQVGGYSAEEDGDGVASAVESFVVERLVDVSYELFLLRIISSPSGLSNSRE
jgi:hypothetical protein